MSAKEQREEEVVEPKKTEQPDSFRFEIVSQRFVHYDQYCGFGAHEGGNSWVRLVGPDGIAQSWGFFPTQQQDVPMHPSHGHITDPSRTGYMPDRVMSYEIKADKASRVQNAVERKRSQPGEYDVMANNCATFAQQMAHAAGVSVALNQILLPNQKAVLGRMAQLRAEPAKTKAVESESEE